MANQIINKDDSNDKNKLVVSDNNNKIQDISQRNKVVFKISLAGILLILFACILIITIFSIINYKDTKIKKGITIEGIDVSELTKQEAKDKIQKEFIDNLPDTIFFQYGENQYSLALEQINAQFEIDEAIENAYEIGRIGSILNRNFKVLSLKKNIENVTIPVKYDEVAIDACIIDISTKLPEQVEQSSYYIEDDNLIITSGKIGKAASPDETKELIINALNNKDFKDKYYDIPTFDKYPDPIDVDKIHSEVYKEVKDAYFTTEPRMVYPEQTGVDFAQSVDEVKKIVTAEKKDEYEIPLKYTKAKVTVQNLGMEAFPNKLSKFSTNYVNNPARTTNLRLASKKINGIVIMPGQTFSYNKIVGERTIAAGYKEAPIYVNGKVEDGLGGGICQVTTTLYNAVLYANLEIVERSNHMFLTSYVGGGRDATVAYGSRDFKFKNNRNYPIKISSSVKNGRCLIEIYGLKTQDDYEVKITTRQTGARTYKAYKKLYKNGKLIDTILLSTDTYSKHPS